MYLYKSFKIHPYKSDEVVHRYLRTSLLQLEYHITHYIKCYWKKLLQIKLNYQGRGYKSEVQRSPNMMVALPHQMGITCPCSPSTKALLSIYHNTWERERERERERDGERGGGKGERFKHLLIILSYSFNDGSGLTCFTAKPDHDQPLSPIHTNP